MTAEALGGFLGPSPGSRRRVWAETFFSACSPSGRGPRIGQTSCRKPSVSLFGVLGFFSSRQTESRHRASQKTAGQNRSKSRGLRVKVNQEQGMTATEEGMKVNTAGEGSGQQGDGTPRKKRSWELSKRKKMGKTESGRPGLVHGVLRGLRGRPAEFRKTKGPEE